jgi:flavorubredoxin
MTVLIVVESSFGNTLIVARAIASGLAQPLGEGEVTVIRPQEAPRELPSDVSLLLVGAPTHEFSMPKEASRKTAAEKGATIEGSVGVREWIEEITPRAGLRVVTFDTSVKMKFMPGSASKAAFKALRKRGFGKAERGQTFNVAGTTGPLVGGEEQRAEAWGMHLGESLRA